MARILSVDEAVAAHVRPGMHLHFGSHPFRANAALFAVARAFRGRAPGFVLSASGFHSSAHLLGRLRLGRRYVGCFFGDHWPAPRPNPLYQRLADEGAVLEHWSLLSYVAALRAGALGEPWAVTRSLVGSDMAAALGDRYREVEIDGERVALVRAMRPDVAFVHGVLGDAEGNVLIAPPGCEGAWAALGAREGVVATVERIVPTGELRRHRDLLPIPPHRVRAVCEAPGGAWPQPSFVPRSVDAVGYPDDFGWYEAWRRIGADDRAFAAFEAGVLDAPDPAAALRDWPVPPPPARSEPDDVVRLAADHVAARVRAGGYPVVLAGIGQSFQAARLAKRTLAEEGRQVRLVVEIGLYDLDPDAGDYLLSHAHVDGAARHTDVEDALGAVTCGADARSLAVLGAAQVDRAGNLNSTRLASGRLLVGSGGANDIASRATEVVVLCPVDRLVPSVDFVTSPGRAVGSIVTEAGVLHRAPDGWDGPAAALARFQEP